MKQDNIREQGGAEAENYHGNHGKNSHSHTHGFRVLERKRLLIAIFLTVAMMIAEIAGGIISGSLSLLSDAGHIFTHCFALFVSYFAIKFACRPATGEQSFGFYRAEIIAAFINGITLILISGFIIWEAYKRIIHPLQVNEFEMLIVAVAGLLINIFTAAILYGAGRESLNVRSAFIHMIGDAGSSVGVVAGAVIIYFTGFNPVDAIFSIVIAIGILIWAYSLLRSSFRILMEFTPKNINPERVKEKLLELDGQIKNLHDLHIWEITSGIYCMSAHMTVDDMSVSQTGRLLDKITAVLEKNFNIRHPIIQFETGENANHVSVCNLNGITEKKPH